MKKATSSFLSLLTLLTGLGLTGRGQDSKPLAQAPASERQLIAIKVSGSKRFPEADIAASTGLQIGTAVTDDDFKKAARRLGDTGAFTEIGYKFSFSSAGTKVEFDVTDAQKFVPARFEDFVWFSDAEMRRRIKEHVPLFNGDLPLSGNMPDQVSDVLQAMLVEGGIPGHVDYQRVGKSDGPVDAIDYTVSEVLIRVRNINFTGASEPELSALKAAAENRSDPEYSRARLDLLLPRQLLPVYYAHGYLKASFSEPQPTPVKDAEPLEEGPRNQSVVDVTFVVTPGAQYRLKKIEWSGNHEFPTDTLQKLIHVEPGQPANIVRLGDNLKDIQNLYGSRGFLKASIKPEAQYDEPAATVTIHLDVKEDFAYRMGELEFRGLDNSLTAKLRNIWKLRQGDIYDATYLSEYLPEAHKLLPANLDWDVASHVTANVRDKTVDVDLIYSVKAPK